MSAILKTRIRNPEYLKKLTSPEEAIKYFQNGQYLGWSGFTGVGGPKVIPEVSLTRISHFQQPFSTFDCT